MTIIGSSNHRRRSHRPAITGARHGASRSFQPLLVGLLVTLAGMGAGCARSANALEGQAPPAQFAQVLGAGLPEAEVRPANVRLIRAGDAPQEPLAMAATVGATQRVTVRQGATLAFLVEDERITSEAPTQRAVIDLEVLGEGDPAPVRATVAESGLEGGGNDAEARELADRMMSRFGGQREIAAAASGRLVGQEPILPDDEPGELVLLGLIDHRPLSLAGPLPSEPIGVGAEWVVTTSSTVAGMPIETTTRYTATTVTADEVRATMARTVHVVPGNHVETQVLGRSELSGTGEAVWLRGAVVGTASYRLIGSLRYYLGPGDFLIQEIDRWVSTTDSVNLPDPPEDDPPGDDQAGDGDGANAGAGDGADPGDGDAGDAGAGDAGAGDGDAGDAGAGDAGAGDAGAGDAGAGDG